LPKLVITHPELGKWEKQSIKEWTFQALNSAHLTAGQVEEAIATISEAAEKQRLEAELSKRRSQLSKFSGKVEAPALVYTQAFWLHEEALKLKQELEELKWEALVLGLIASQ